MDQSTPSEADRRAIAAQLERLVTTRFRGRQNLAYGFAQVNPTTWKKLMSAEPVRSHVLVDTVTAFWPETEGDWRQIPGLRASAQDVLDLAERADISTKALAAIRRALTAETGRSDRAI